MTGTAGQINFRMGRHPKGGCLPDIDDGEFADWARLLEQKTGLFIAPERKSFLATGLRTRMRETGCKNYREYYLKLSRGAIQAREWSLLVDCLTVHESCFFRHSSSINLVEEVVLPETVDRNEGISVWSIGCATGEEPYSLAMLIDAYRLKCGKKFFFGITGTDVSLPALRHARKGIYLNRRLSKINAEFQAKYIRSVSDNRFEVVNTLRERVCFAQLNLRDIEKSPFGGVDLIYCQNVLIYYHRERRASLVECLVPILRPGGFLVLGPGELLNWQHPKMKKVPYADTLAYRRIQE
ncbi:MAG: hypothetical protein J5I92_12985 [Thiogranum sp.]|nr:hypothetical protein [Thiogranum sp.]